ncbi:Mlp84B [Symbiodinium natans]|uniref:Mlp84B protein n=1 Tax=Symbiodinium natans TaxID=878477 RepID=A0A812LIP2_9DINO|nr:Mlp84B [Symbiodinium natans]
MAKFAAAPKCPACSKSVYAAEEVKALDSSWHPLCFCCKACGKSLRGGNYKDHDGQPYCEADYSKLFGPKGIGFGSTLGDTGIVAAEEAANADAEVTEAVSIRDRRAAFEKKTAPADSVAKAPAPSARFQSSAPKCPACGKSVFAAEEVKGLGQSWHVLCFCCKACGKSLRGGQYKDHDGQPYCEADYNKLYGPKGIGFGATLGDTGIAAAAGASSTEVPSEGYAGGGLKEKMAAFEGQGTPKAKVDVAQTDASPTRASKGFVPFSAPKCPACGKSVFAAEEVKGLGQSWHALCFCCKACGKSLRGGQYKDHEGHPYCEADYNKLFGPKGIGFGATLGDTGIAAKAPEEGAPASSPEGGYASALKDRMAAFEGQKPVPGAADETAEADKSLAGMAKSALQPAAPKCPACSKSVYAAEQILGGQYKDHDGQPYCEADYSKLFGPKGIGFGSTLGDTGKAGVNRWLGWRPSVRGTAMDPHKHPHGGGTSAKHTKRPPVSPWGILRTGYKTRSPLKPLGLIVRRKLPGKMQKKFGIAT